jgi:hypothetical protein
MIGNMNSKPAVAVLLVFVLALFPACRNPIDTSALDSFAKTDVDVMADTSLQEMNRLMEDLLYKLYARNPLELSRGSGLSVGHRQEQIFGTEGRLVFQELGRAQGTNALNLAFNKDFSGDRVFALMVGLVGMVRSAYNWQTEQFIFDSLNEQELFNCARNIELLATRLSHSRDENGKLLLLSNSQPGEIEDLSFERIFGKMIAIQDLLAFTVAGKWERGFSSVVKQAVFLPMGL